MAAKLPDLNNIMKTLAWEEMEKSGCIFSKEEVQVDIDWEDVNIISNEPEFCNKTDLKDSGSQVMHKSVFVNNSDHAQKHGFRTSEQKTSLFRTILADGFTRGNSGIITLKVPSEVTKSTSHFGKEVIINEDGRMTRKSRTWNEFTNITAAPRKKTFVEIILAEKTFECDFNMDVRLSGNVVVKIKHLMSGEKLMVFQKDLATVLYNIERKQDKSLVLTDGWVTWSVAGHVEFVFGAELKTLIWRESLPYDDVYNDCDVMASLAQHRNRSWMNQVHFDYPDLERRVSSTFPSRRTSDTAHWRRHINLNTLYFSQKTNSSLNYSELAESSNDSLY